MGKHNIISHFREKVKRTRAGAASFYIVSFATLLLTVIAVSFATVMTSQIGRTSDDDLSNSAYDSALAGVEDAKSAIVLYEACKSNSNYATNCSNVISTMEATEDTASVRCDKVGIILGRYSSGSSSGEVMVQESQSSGSATNDTGVNRMSQAYTCVEVTDKLDDYKSTLTTENYARIIKVKLEKASSNVTSIRVRWYSSQNGSANLDTDGHKFVNDSSITFPTSNGTSPSVLALTILQTDKDFTMDEVNHASWINGVNYATDLISMFLVPTTSGSTTTISSADVVKTSDRNTTNKPFAVHCDTTNYSYDGVFACEATIGIVAPLAINGTTVSAGTRYDDTFAIMVALPYRAPATDFSLSFLDSGGNIIKTDGMQYLVDSTGRASDLYRRMETRIETSNSYFPFPDSELSITGDGESALSKDIYSIVESHCADFETNHNCDTGFSTAKK